MTLLAEPSNKAQALPSQTEGGKQRRRSLGDTHAVCTRQHRPGHGPVLLSWDKDVSALPSWALVSRTLSGRRVRSARAVCMSLAGTASTPGVV